MSAVRTTTKAGGGAVHYRAAGARAGRRGSVYVLALLIIVLFASLSAALFAASGANMHMSSNFRDVLDARLAAESGLAYTIQALLDVRMPPGTAMEDMLPALTTSLGAMLDGTGNLNGQSIAMVDGAVVIPPIRVGRGEFTSRIFLDGPQGDSRAIVAVTGTCEGARRTLSMELRTVQRRSSVFDYGVASRGRIYITGHATIDGVDDPRHATILSTRGEPLAIEAGGSATIGGDLYVTGGDPSYVMIKGGGLTIAGETDPLKIVENHVHLGTVVADFPEIDISPFVPMATSIIAAKADYENKTTLTNVVIEPGVNPTFASGTVIEGVLYIKGPNTVTFAGQVTINGIIVTDAPEGTTVNDNMLKFSGQVSAPGPGALPDTPQFAELRQHEGTVMLAPGFTLRFGGSSNSINGVIAADKVEFRGNSSIDGDLAGSVLGLADHEMVLTGNATLRLKRQPKDNAPPGFIHPTGLAPVAGTYSEGAI